MSNAYLKNIFIVIFALFIFCSNCCYSKSVDYVALNTAPVTLSPEEFSENNTPKQVEKTLPIEIKPIKIENKSAKSIKNLNYKNTTLKNIKNSVSANLSENKNQTKNTVKTVKSLEILDYDAEDDVFKNKESESFLLVPIDKEQLEAENQQYKIEDLSTSLIKDAPKALTTKAKLKSRIYSYVLKKYGKTLDLNLKKLILISLLVKLLIFILIVILGVLGYFFYQKRKAQRLEIERIKNLSYEEKKRNELIQAIEEFEQTEENHKKLGPKIYINELEKYKSLDGFKMDEVADDIYNTMETIEKAQKSEEPLTLKDNKTSSFKKNNYAFENDIGILSDEEGIALFDDDNEGNKFLSEEEFLNPDYYSENSEIFNNAQLNDDIFIIEDEDENQENEYKIVEEKPVQKKNTDNSEKISKPAKNENQLNSNKKANPAKAQNKPVKQVKKPEEPKLEIKERYPLDDNRGFALLSYKQMIALIGYIGENITVLKRFSPKDEAKNLSVRVYEVLSDTNVQYLVRAGKFKGIVEINADVIKLVMNL